MRGWNWAVGLMLLGVLGLGMLAGAQERRDGLPAPALADVSYGPHERNVIDFWRADTEKPAPLLVYFHGGGFRGGDKVSVNKTIFQSCREAGIAFAAANYRLSGQALYPAQMQDTARAIQFLRSKAAEWNIDPGRVGAFGGSAGAGISLWLAFHDDMARPDSADAVARQSTRLSFGIGMQAQCTYDPREIMKIVPGEAYDHPALKELHGLPADWDWKTAEISPELSAKLIDSSPITHLTKDDPPVFVFHQAAQDKPGDIHSANFGRHLKKVMEAMGLSCKHTMDSDYASREAAFLDIAAFVKEQFGVAGK